MIRSVVEPFPYGLLIFLNSLLVTASNESTIDSARGDTCITLSAATLPFCRSPILTVGMPNEGASIIPLDEFPTTAAVYCIKDRYLNCPRLLKAMALSVFSEINLSIKSIMILPFASALGFVKTIFSSGNVSNALSSSLNCLSAVWSSNVAG